MAGESSVGKKMAAAHFTTTPCEPNTACKVQGKPHFCSISPCAIDIMYTGFEGFGTFLYVFMSVFLSFRVLRIMGKCTKRHLFSYGGLLR